jgi:pyruvate dehydrogenase E1 component alpha subunit
MATTKTMAKKETKEKYGKETYLKWYELMTLIRKFEERAGHLYIQQKIRGFCHLYIGQEAIVAGCEAVLRPEDKMITTYRDHAHPIGRGTEPKFIMAELYGKITGVSKGKGGSMHMFDKSHNFFGGHGIVGAHIPMGAGIAFADKYNGNKAVTICFMGDGAIRQGAFHEALNMAMTWKLPVIFVIENNQYAMGTSVERTSNVTELWKLGLAYDMPSFPVNGMKCEDVADAVEEATARARKGDGPTLLEIRTYRYKGHSMSDPAKYRTKEELENYKDQDPINDVLSTIKAKKFATDKEIEAIDAKNKAIVEEAVQFAEDSPIPTLDELYKDVYHQKDYPYIMD